MVEKKDIGLNIMLVIILIIKILWIISLFSHLLIKFYLNQFSHYINVIDNLEYMLHDIFTMLLGILLIYLFSHLTQNKVCIEGHTKIYLVSFGILSLIGSLQKFIHKYYFREYRELAEEL